MGAAPTTGAAMAMRAETPPTGESAQPTGRTALPAPMALPPEPAAPWRTTRRREARAPPTNRQAEPERDARGTEQRGAPGRGTSRPTGGRGLGCRRWRMRGLEKLRRLGSLLARRESRKPRARNEPGQTAVARRSQQERPDNPPTSAPARRLRRRRARGRGGACEERRDGRARRAAAPACAPTADGVRRSVTARRACEKQRRHTGRGAQGRARRGRGARARTSKPGGRAEQLRRLRAVAGGVRRQQTAADAATHPRRGIGAARRGEPASSTTIPARFSRENVPLRRRSVLANVDLAALEVRLITSARNKPSQSCIFSGRAAMMQRPDALY